MHISQVYCVYTLSFCEKTHQLVCRYNKESLIPSCRVITGYGLILTCEASIEFYPHGDVSVPSSGMNPNVTASQYWNKGIRDNSVLVTVSREVL